MVWKGYLSLGGAAVPCNSTGLEIEPGFKFSDDVISSKGHVINYAQIQNAYQGTVEFPLNRDFMATLWAWAITARDTTKTVILSPDGTTVYTYPETSGKCLVKTLTITGAQNDYIKCSLDLVATGRSAAGSVPTYTATSTTNVNYTPIPYWKTSFISTTPTAYGGASDATQVVSWNVSINNNQFVLYTFDLSNDPHDIQPGLMDVTGNVVLYNATTTPIPSDGGSTIITIDNDSLTLNYLVYTKYAMEMSGPNVKATRSCDFRSIGDTTNTPIRE